MVHHGGCTELTWTGSNNTWTTAASWTAEQTLINREPAQGDDVELAPSSGSVVLRVVTLPAAAVRTARQIAIHPDAELVIDEDGDLSLSPQCVDCAVGHGHEPIGASSTDYACVACGEGEHKEASGNVACDACLAGEFQDEPGQALCDACPAGRYQTGTGASNCTACPLGTSSSATGATSESTCEPCAIGSYADTEGSALCTSCPGVEETATTGSMSADDCSLAGRCTAGSGPCCNDTSQRVFDASEVCRPINADDACDYVEERCDFVNPACPADVRERVPACCGASLTPPTASIATNPARPKLGQGYRVLFTFAKTVTVQSVWELRVEEDGDNLPLKRLVLSSELGSISGELDGGMVLTYELPPWSLNKADHQYRVVLSAGSVQDLCAGNNSNVQLSHNFTTAAARGDAGRDALAVDVTLFAKTTQGSAEFEGFAKADLEQLFPAADFTVKVLKQTSITCNDDNAQSGLQFRVRFVSNEAGGPAQSHADALMAMLRSRSSVIMQNSASYALDTAFEDPSCGVSTLSAVLLEKCDSGDLKAACDDCDPVPDRTVYVVLAGVGALVLVMVLLKKCAPGVMGSVRNGLSTFATPRAFISVAANGLDTAYDVLFLLEVAPSAMETPGSLSFTLFFFVVLLAIATGYIFMWHVVGGWLFSSCSKSACVQAMPLYGKAHEEGWALHKRLANPTHPRKSFSTWLIFGDLVTIALTTVIGFNECLTETTFVSIVTSLVVVAIEVASLLSDSSTNALGDVRQLSTSETMSGGRDLEGDGVSRSGDIALETRS